MYIAFYIKYKKITVTSASALNPKCFDVRLSESFQFGRQPSPAQNILQTTFFGSWNILFTFFTSLLSV